MKKVLIAAGCVIVSVMSASKATAANLNFSQFFVFGDSLSDTGNIFTGTSALGNPIPVPKTTSGQAAYFNGRFSNGSIWVDYFGDQIGKQPIPYLQSLLPGSSTQGGVNYAFGAAETGVQSINAPVPGILGQVGLFSNQPNLPVDTNAIYSILGGANDYTSALTRGITPNVSEVVGNLTNSINLLAQKNAKNFLVSNLPNLGDTPLASTNKPTQPLLNALTQEHNSQLATALNVLRTQRPDLNIYSVDLNGLFNTLRSNPKQFGFTNVDGTCLIGNNTLATSVCKNPDEFFFFDDVHPSSAVHKFIANAALASIKNGNKSIPEPSMALGLLTLAIGLGAKRVVKRKSKKLVFNK